jgi:GrpB-like predicted nucleotidyltransferase (UPF0157 family)
LAEHARAEYARIKTAFATQHADDRAAYTCGKASFVGRVVEAVADEEP